MTLDNLVNIYNEAADDVASAASQLGHCPSGNDMRRAGIKAVVWNLSDAVTSVVMNANCDLGRAEAEGMVQEQFIHTICGDMFTSAEVEDEMSSKARPSLYDRVITILDEESAWVAGPCEMVASRIAIAAGMIADQEWKSGRPDKDEIAKLKSHIELLEMHNRMHNECDRAFEEIYPTMPLKRCGHCGGWARIPCGEGCCFDPARDPTVAHVLETEYAKKKVL